MTPSERSSILSYNNSSSCEKDFALATALGHQYRFDKLVQTDFVTKYIPLSFRRSEQNKAEVRAQQTSTELCSPLEAIITPLMARLQYARDLAETVVWTRDI